MTDVTEMLVAISNGDQQAAEKLLPVVYEDLRKLAAAKLAQEAPGQTLQATALVHEAYLRLVGASTEQQWDHRGHFFVAAATAMRRILVDNARRKQALKRGGHLANCDIELGGVAEPQREQDLLDLEEALNKLVEEHERKAKLVELRYFIGLTMAQAAEILEISLATAERDWTFARAWLKRELSSDSE